MATNSSVLVRVITDGFRRDASGKPLALRVSLALMPDLRGNSGGPTVNIENWCLEIYKLRKELKLFAGTDPNADRPTEVKWYARGNLAGDSGPKDGPLAREFDEVRAKAANALCGGYSSRIAGRWRSSTTLLKRWQKPKSLRGA